MEKMYQNKNEKEILQKSVNMDYPVLLIGETGCGKTSMVRELAEDARQELFRLNLTGQTGTDEILGKWLIKNYETVWIDGLLVDAMRKGKWVVMDEINMASQEILSALHSLLDHEKSVTLIEKEGEKITPHQDFRFFATMNPEEDYAGTKELNKAFLSRFPVVLSIGYSEHEQKILEERTGIDSNIAERLILMAKELRNQKNKEKINYICSTRDILYCANLIAKEFQTDDALKVAILNKVEKEDKEKVEKTIELVTKEKITFKAPSGAVVEVNSIKEIEQTLKDYKKEIDQVKEQFNEYKELADNLESETRMAKNQLKDLVTEIDEILSRQRYTKKDQVRDFRGKIDQISVHLARLTS